MSSRSATRPVACCASDVRGSIRAGRKLPLEARRAIAEWTQGRRLEECEPRAAKAHQRLLREFLQQHLADGRPLRAFDAWEQGALVAR